MNQVLVYLSGPMTGIEHFNYPAFHKAAKRLRELGVDVLNPAETAGGATHLPRETYMDVDIGYVKAAQAVVVMEGWRQSRGAKLEVIVAVSMGRTVFTYCPKRGIGSQIAVTDWAVAAEERPVTTERVDGDPDDPEDDSDILPLFAPVPGIN